MEPADPTEKRNAPPGAPASGRWARWGRLALATGFWFFLIKGLVWLVVLGAALFLGIEVVQADGAISIQP